MKPPLLYVAAIAVLSPFVSSQEIKLLPPDGAEDDEFGWSIDANEAMVIVGSPLDDNPGLNTGSAYLYDASSGEQIVKITPSDGNQEDEFGYSVALGNGIVFVGARKHDAAGQYNSGAGYLFDSDTGIELSKFTPGDSAPDYFFGASACIDENTILVGSPGAIQAGTRNGAAYLFDISDPQNPVELGKLATPHGSGSEFGISVDLKGSSAIVGAWKRDFSSTLQDCGSAHVFDTSTMSEIAHLYLNPPSSFDYIGSSVGIYGSIAVVGHPSADFSGVNSGSAHVFDVTTGQYLSRLSADDSAPFDAFGKAISIDNTGVAFIGAPGADIGSTGNGAIYVFNTSTGAQIGKLYARDGGDQDDNFGHSISANNKTVAVGAFNSSTNSIRSGAAYLISWDCNNNGVFDGTEIQNDASLDCDGSGGIDGCELVAFDRDCNFNGIYDPCECLAGTTADCNSNLIPDICEGLPDCNSDGVPDECELDCNSNGTPDACESLVDCNADGTPDECQSLDDCDNDGEPNVCEIASGNDTDLNANEIPDSCECLASYYCTASPNTAGAGVLINTSGTPSVALKSLGIDATGGPSNQPGLFFHGPGTANQPFGEGIRCVSAPIIRVAPPVFFNSTGAASKQLDMNSTALSSIQPADTRYFQLWYRDPQGGPFGFNLSNGLEITFCP